MDKFTMTEREYEIMQILWRNGKPMLASDIMKKVKSASSNSVHNILNKLMRRGFVKVAGSIMMVKSQSRLFTAAVSPAEYLALQSADIFKSTTKKFEIKNYLVCLIKKNKNKADEIISELKSFLAEYDIEEKCEDEDEAAED